MHEAGERLLELLREFSHLPNDCLEFFCSLPLLDECLLRGVLFFAVRHVSNEADGAEEAPRRVV